MDVSITNKPSKILVGISLDVEESKELISWAIRVLAKPNDTIIAQHIVGKFNFLSIIAQHTVNNVFLSIIATIIIILCSFVIFSTPPPQTQILYVTMTLGE